MPLATSRDHGHNLQTVQLLIKKNQVSFCSGQLGLISNCSKLQNRECERALKACNFSLALMAWHKQHAVAVQQASRLCCLLP